MTFLRFRRVVSPSTMPKRFTPEQIASSAAIGELRTQHLFGGDTEAWHTYQDTVYSKLRPGEALHANRPVLWKAAARQLKKIEAELNKPATWQAGQEAQGLDAQTVPGPLRRPARLATPLSVRHARGLPADGERARLRVMRRGRLLRAATSRRRERQGDQDACRPPSAPRASRAREALLRAYANHLL